MKPSAVLCGVISFQSLWKGKSHGCYTCSIYHTDMCTIITRYSEAQHHKTLLEFLKSVGDTYQEQRRAKNFVLDLLHIDVSKLFAEGHEKPPLQHEGGAGTSEEFSAFLCTYIQKFSISGAVLQDINLIWVCF